MSDDEVISFDLNKITFTWEDESRIDKYRATGDGSTALFHGKVQDAGRPVDVIVKVSMD